MTRPALDVPVIDCPQVDASELSADIELEPWRTIVGAPFLETVSATAPQQGSQVRCTWTPLELRVLIDCEDIYPWATITQRDGPLWEEEVVEVFLDPIGDGEAYFEIEVNPLNTVLDLALRRNRSGWKKDFDWNCEGMRTATRTKRGWSAEFSIPFAAVAVRVPQAGEEWRVNFCRIDRPAGAPRELTAWSPTRVGTFHAPERFGRLRFGS